MEAGGDVRQPHRRRPGPGRDAPAQDGRAAARRRGDRAPAGDGRRRAGAERPDRRHVAHHLLRLRRRRHRGRRRRLEPGPPPVAHPGRRRGGARGRLAGDLRDTRRLRLGGRPGRTRRAAEGDVARAGRPLRPPGGRRAGTLRGTGLPRDDRPRTAGARHHLRRELGPGEPLLPGPAPPGDDGPGPRRRHGAAALEPAVREPPAGGQGRPEQGQVLRGVGRRVRRDRQPFGPGPVRPRDAHDPPEPAGGPQPVERRRRAGFERRPRPPRPTPRP